ncbi:MAG: hypothetical protein ACRC57_10020 [Sarcina sp.]
MNDPFFLIPGLIIMGMYLGIFIFLVIIFILLIKVLRRGIRALDLYINEKEKN